MEEPPRFAEGIGEAENGDADEDISDLIPFDSFEVEGEADRWP